MLPKISVLMSTFNRENLIDKSIKSILNQTYTNFEFIICDDGSTDNTLRHLKFWSKKDDRIKVLINNHNQGLQKSLNKCIKCSTGEYIARMDDDDISSLNRFAIQIKFLQTHPNITFIGSNIKLFDISGVYGSKIFIKEPTIYQLFKQDEFCHPSIMIRSKVLKHIGGYSINKCYFRIEDHELWLRLYLLGYRGANIQKYLLKYHFDIHHNHNKFYDYYNRFRLLKTYKKKFHIGFKGYFYVFLPLIKLIVPSFLRNMVYSYKYNNRKGMNNN